MSTQPTPQTFHFLNLPVTQTSLIEASAGTGKTYGISALYCRLVVIEAMPIERILTVTFSKAATAELKTRLRARLNDALEALLKIDQAAENIGRLKNYIEENSEYFIYELLQIALEQHTQSKLILLLKTAINDFDRAAIFTIHSFCQKVLTDYAFWCGVLPNTDIENDFNEAIRRFAADFWLERVSCDPYTAELMHIHHTDPYQLLPQTNLLPHIHHINAPTPADISNALHTLLQQAQTIKAQSERYIEAFRSIFEQQILSKTSFPEKYLDCLNNLSQLPIDTNLSPLLQLNALKAFSDGLKPSLNKLDYATMQKAVKKKFVDSIEQWQTELNTLNEVGNFFQQINSLYQQSLDAVISIQAEMFQYIATQLKKYKHQHAQHSYDDLIIELDTALNQGNFAEPLAKAMANTWHAALIDEFQDTDSLQYRIFQRAFIQEGRPVYLVGDPKQSIYKFRGADLATYYHAVQSADHHYSLDTNYRSSAALINFVNQLFSFKKQPFITEGMFHPVQANRDQGRLNPPQAAIDIISFSSTLYNKASKKVLQPLSADSAANAIAELLNHSAKGDLTITDKATQRSRPLEPRDITVLVRSESEAHLMQDALKIRGLPASFRNKQSVYQTPEAHALKALLDFWLNPKKSDLLKFVLTSPLFGYNAEEIQSLENNEQLLPAWIEAAQEAYETWQKQGLYTAMRHFTRRFNIEKQLLAQGNERSLTNFYHLLELAAQEDEKLRNPKALKIWIEHHINTPNQTEDFELRLETDEDLIQIQTIHASKGLEYPVVVCPFLWSVKVPQTPEWNILSNGANNVSITHQSLLTTEDTNQLKLESLREEAHLLYVALTRATEKLILVVQPFYYNQTISPLNYLLTGDDHLSYTQAAEALKLQQDSPEWQQQVWQKLKDSNPDTIHFIEYTNEPSLISYTPNNHQNTEYRAASYPSRTYNRILHTSFTGMSRKLHEPLDSLDIQPEIDTGESGLTNRPSENSHPSIQSGILTHTELHSDGIKSPTPADIYQFPKGAQAGLVLHDLLENFDFNQPAQYQQTLITEILDRNNLEHKWLPTLTAMLNHVAHQPLTQGVSLSSIPAENRLPEMGFLLHSQHFHPRDVSHWLKENSWHQVFIDAAQALAFDDIAGFISGFIDMVCIDYNKEIYVIDYKSNFLGADPSAYHPEAMTQAMADHHYYLQALIYAIAVARYFKQRNSLPTAINVQYFFLRGMGSDLASNNGVWSQRITTASLSQWLE